MTTTETRRIVNVCSRIPCPTAGAHFCLHCNAPFDCRDRAIERENALFCLPSCGTRAYWRNHS